MSDRPTIWEPPGPVARRFFEAPTDDPFLCLMGPVGSAKTTTGLMRIINLAWRLRPARDGVRYGKFPVIRRLYKDLEATTMASWREWFPRTMGKWTGGKGDPAVHELPMAHPADGGLVQLRVEFIALGDLRIEEALRSYEATAAFTDEMDGLPPDSLGFLFSRMGRYRKECGEHLRSVFGATNAPEEGNWLLPDFIDDPKPGHVLFRQPGGLDPGAENLQNLPGGRAYYELQARSASHYFKRRFIDCVPGLSQGDAAVYEEFDEGAHMSPTPIPLLSSPIRVGLDAGGTPAAGIWQVAPNGQKRKLRELSTHLKEAGSITGPERFGDMLAQLLHDLLQTLPAGQPRPPIRGIADPSAAYGADTANGESTWIEIVARKAGIPVYPAPSNDPTPRMEVYRRLMTQRIDGRIPALLIDPSCRLTRRALARDYRYGAILGQNARRTDKPLKNWASHLVEADQYGLLDADAYHEVMQRRTQQGQRLRVVQQPSRRINPFRAA